MSTVEIVPWSRLMPRKQWPSDLDRVAPQADHEFHFHTFSVTLRTVFCHRKISGVTPWKFPFRFSRIRGRNILAEYGLAVFCSLFTFRGAVHFSFRVCAEQIAVTLDRKGGKVHGCRWFCLLLRKSRFRRQRSIESKTVSNLLRRTTCYYLVSFELSSQR